VGLPMDVGVSNDGRHFYTLNGNQGIVSVFNIQDDGSLVRLQVAAWTNFPYLGSQLFYDSIGYTIWWNRK